MSKETLKYKPEIALRNYSMNFGLILISFVMLRSLGNPLQLILLKIAVVPLFFLSFGGLRSIYRYPIVEHKITARAVEYFLLESLIFALILFVFLWEPSRALNELLGIFFISLVAFSIIKLSMLVLIAKRNARYPQNS